MNAKRITRSAALLALLTALAVPAGPAQAAGPAPRNTDFNGDGYNDLALGMPNYRGEDGSWNRGMVTVLYGGPNGFDGHWTRRPAADCTAPNGKRCYMWGKSVAAGDVDADGRADLTFTADDGTRVQSWTSQGVTEIEYRGQDLAPFSSLVGPMVGQFDDRPGSDIVGAWSSGWYESVVGGWYNRDASAITQGFDLGDSDVRVNSAATGDVDGDGRQEMSVVAVQHHNGWNSTFLWLLKDVKKQPLDVSDRAWGWEVLCNPGTRNVRGCPKPDSRVAMGDVDGNGHLDVVMATPSTRSLQVWYGSASGPTAHPGFSAHDLEWFDPNQGLLDRGLAVGDVNGDGAAEIAIGNPQAASSGQYAAGAVVLIPGSTGPTGGPVLANAQLITQDGIGPVTPPSPAPTPTASVTPTTGPTPTVTPTVTPTPTPVPTASVTPSTGSTPTTPPEPTVTFDPKQTSEPQSLTAPRAAATLSDPIGEQSQANDRFGEEIRIIDITGDGKGEVVIGVPGKNMWPGMLAVLRGTAAGVSTTAAQVVHPDQLGLDDAYGFGRTMMR